MCIIIAKPRKASLPDKGIMRQCFSQNPDGAGFAYWDQNKGQVALKKGYMYVESLLEALKEIPQDALAIVHFRLATSGLILPQNTHPFIWSNNIRELTTLEAETNQGVLAHNGTLDVSLTNESDLAHSDTMLFIRDSLSHLNCSDRHTDFLLRQVAHETNGRFALLHNGCIALFGDWVETEQGYYLSHNLDYWDDLWEQDIDLCPECKTHGLIEVEYYLVCSNCGQILEY